MHSSATEWLSWLRFNPMLLPQLASFTGVLCVHTHRCPLLLWGS